MSSTRSSIIAGLFIAGLAGLPSAARAQSPTVTIGEAVPRDMREIYDRGLQYLATTQGENGDWPGGGGEQGAGVTGLGLMVFLASGEDPNFGLYSSHVRKSLRNIISGQDAETGYLGPSMYHHGFAMLALSEAYGSVDDRDLWVDGSAKNQRSIGAALELAVRSAITSQKKNPVGAWRYSPGATDADTSVSGAVLVGLLAARNAGVEVPDECIDKGINYYIQMTALSGQVAYTGGLGGFDESLSRVSIATLVFAIAGRKDLPQYKSALQYLVEKSDTPGPGGVGYAEYQRYYQAQALFQGDMKAWERWNKQLIEQLQEAQLPDGSIKGQFGPLTSTTLSLLALALNYRFLPIYER
jgi:hypothetical protein